MNEHYTPIATLLDKYIDSHEITFQQLTEVLKLYMKSMANRVMAGKREDE